MKALPLAGIRVLDCTISWAGPHATLLLADLGAQVIKIEAIQYMDPLRGAVRPQPSAGIYPDNDPGERPWERAAFFNAVTRNKYGITLDLTQPRGKELFLRLLKISDVVAESFTVGVMHKFGLDYETLRAVKPDVIMLSMPGFGTTGPYRNYRIYGHSTEAIALQKFLRAYGPGEPPMSTPLPYGDPTSGVMGAFALLAALEYRRRTGLGQSIDLSQCEALVPLLGEVVMDYTMNGRIQEPVGNRHPSMAPHGCYRCRGEDQWVTIAVRSDAEWARLCALMGCPELVADPRFDDVLSRLGHQAELDEILESWTREQDALEVMHRLQGVGIPAGAVLTNQGVLADPHLHARGFFEIVAHPQAGTHPYPGMTFQLSKTPLHIRLPATGLGEYNEFAYRELLGLSAEEIAELEGGQIIGTNPLPGQDARSF